MEPVMRGLLERIARALEEQNALHRQAIALQNAWQQVDGVRFARLIEMHERHHLSGIEDPSETAQMLYEEAAARLKEAEDESL